MHQLRGTVKNGHVILDEAAELPEGTRVEVVPLEASRAAQGMREEDWPTTPEGIAALLARMDQLGPGWMSPEEEAYAAGESRRPHASDRGGHPLR